MKKIGFFVQSLYNRLDFEQLFLSRLDWRPVREESQLNAYVFVPLLSCLAI